MNRPSQRYSPASARLVRRTDHSRRRGFTLIEGLVAGMILAGSAAALSLSIRQAMRSTAMARNYQRAAELLDITLIKIDTVGPARLALEGPKEGVFEPPYQRFTWDAAIEAPAEGHLYDVTVRIRWPNAAGTMKSVKAQTFLNDPPRDDNQSTPAWEDL